MSLAATDVVAYHDGHVDRGVSSKVSELKELPEPKYDGPAILCNIVCTWTSRMELANIFCLKGMRKLGKRLVAAFVRCLVERRVPASLTSGSAFTVT